MEGGRESPNLRIMISIEGEDFDRFWDGGLYDGGGERGMEFGGGGG